jgi:hypothetical protein
VLVFWVVDFAQQRTWPDRFWAFTLADVSFGAAIVAFIPALVAWHGDRRTVSAVISNGVFDLQTLGASPESYVLPAMRNPILGGITRHVDPLADHHWAENTLFLGWSLLALGIVGAVLVIRRHPLTLQTPRLRFFLVCMTILAPAAFLCSLKRETSVFGVDIPMPAYLMGEFTTFWRVFARFGLLVTFALAVLAATVLTAALHTGRRGLALALAASALLVVEYYNGVAHVYVFREAAYSTWLARQPKGIVAHYPLPTDSEPAIKLAGRTFYQQTYNGHPQFTVFGSGYGGTREEGIRILARYVDDPLTPGILRAEGVKYILLHDDVYREQGQAPPRVPSGFHLVARIDGHVRALELNDDVQPADLPNVLEQNAASIAATESLRAPVLKLHGFSAPRRVGDSAGWRTVDGEGTIDFESRDDRLRRAVVYANLVSDTPRTLQLVDDSGAVVAQQPVGRRGAIVNLGPVRLGAGTTSFTVRTEPAGPVDMLVVQVQPLADFSTSIAD